VGEETSRPIETYLVVTVLYFISAFAVFLTASAVERAVRVPGVAAGGGR
jgi:glutamate/aspartate transport system permease protein